MDEKKAEFIRRSGLDPTRVSPEAIDALLAHLGVEDPGTGSLFDHLLAQVASRWSNRWSEGDSHLLDEPIEGPIPVEFAEAWSPDPLYFTLELSRAATAKELAAMTSWVAEIGGREAGDDEDHVSFWSEVEAVVLEKTRTPAMRWWFDAAAAGPATIRRLIDGTTTHAIEAGLPARRLILGDPS
jgi:hypothetical protein